MMRIILVGYIIGYILLINVSPRDCAPLAQEKIPPKETENFMKRFGYIDSATSPSDALYTEEGFKAAVQLMQRFGGLPETGELDEATINLTKSRRCGVPDVIKKPRQKRYIIGSKAWKKKKLTYFLANWPSEMEPEVIRSKLAKALNLWSETTPLKFVPREGMDADLIIAFGESEHGDGYPFDGRGNILAHAFFPYEHGSYGGDIHFDDGEEWIDASTKNKGKDIEMEDGVDFYTVASHEIGHSLGLAHSTVPGSIMFPYYKGYDPNMRLDYDDVIAMYSMYYIDNNFEDEPKEPNLPTEKPRTDGDRYKPKEEDEVHVEHDDVTNDYFYPVSDKTPGEDDIYRSDGKTTHGYEYDNTDEVDEYESKDTDNESSTESTTEGEEKVTIVAYTEIPQSTEFSSITAPSPTTRTKIPDICDGSIDAASLIRGELFVFKGMYMWRLRDRNQVLPGYPVYFHHFFMGFPWSVRTIDAVYQRPDDYHIIFFTGRFYWNFDGNRFTSDSPRHLTDLGLPGDLDRLDAAIVWDKNKKTYFFSGDLYWRYDEKDKTMEKGYPQRMARWKGVPKLGAAFTWTDGKTYFFKGKQFWRFNNKNVSVDIGFPLETGPYWFDCPS